MTEEGWSIGEGGFHVPKKGRNHADAERRSKILKAQKIIRETNFTYYWQKGDEEAGENDFDSWPIFVMPRETLVFLLAEGGSVDADAVESGALRNILPRHVVLEDFALGLIYRFTNIALSDLERFWALDFEDTPYVVLTQPRRPHLGRPYMVDNSLGQFIASHRDEIDGPVPEAFKLDRNRCTYILMGQVLKEPAPRNGLMHTSLHASPTAFPMDMARISMWREREREPWDGGRRYPDTPGWAGCKDADGSMDPWRLVPISGHFARAIDDSVGRLDVVLPRGYVAPDHVPQLLNAKGHRQYAYDVKEGVALRTYRYVLGRAPIPRAPPTANQVKMFRAMLGALELAMGARVALENVLSGGRGAKQNATVDLEVLGEGIKDHEVVKMWGEEDWGGLKSRVDVLTRMTDEELGEYLGEGATQG